MLAKNGSHVSCRVIRIIKVSQTSLWNPFRNKNTSLSSSSIRCNNSIYLGVFNDFNDIISLKIINICIIFCDNHPFTKVKSNGCGRIVKTSNLRYFFPYFFYYFDKSIMNHIHFLIYNY